jgi:hypothetical protein
MDEPDDVVTAARALSKRGSARGGRARAERLSGEERSAIARQAARARWGTTVLTATHIGELQIGDRLIACAVLEDGTRVVSQRTLLATLGRAKASGGAGEAGPVLAANLQPFASRDLVDELANPVHYLHPGSGRALGYPARLLPEVCEVYLAARAEGKLLRTQYPAAGAAEILVRGLAQVGIIALVDEATGYQEVRAREELQKILEAYVQAELRPWLKMFPDEFFKEIYRLQGWEYKPGTSKRTPQVGKLVNKYIYEQLPDGVLEELQRRNPKNEKGHRSHKHHQFLTQSTGHPHLDRQISTVTTLMRISDTKAQFETLFERAFPPPQMRLPLVITGEVLGDNDEDPEDHKGGV